LTGFAGGTSLFPVHSRAALFPGRAYSYHRRLSPAPPRKCEHRRGDPPRCAKPVL